MHIELKCQNCLDRSSEISISIYQESEIPSIFLISDFEAKEFCEAPCQLIENSTYEYKCSEGYQLEDIPGVITPSKVQGSTSGRITPKIFVGTLQINIRSLKSNHICSSIRMEVRSIKASYREDYRKMLEDIGENCTNILMHTTSPVVQNFKQTISKDKKTLYQQFSFIRSIINSQNFFESINKIINSPVTRWKEIEQNKDIRRSGKINSQIIRQIASSSNRFIVPSSLMMSKGISTLPFRIQEEIKTDSLDNPENQFIKFVLKTYSSFISEVKHLFEFESRGYKEAEQIEENLDHFLEQPFFKDISMPYTIPLNSPVLQKKEGYREMLRTWLLFDLASKLIWVGGEDVFEAGKRDVATLYEYWVFFKLLEIFKTIFSISPKAIENLIEPTTDGFGLKLKSGKFIALEGVFLTNSRNLNIKFSYNRIYSGNNKYPNAGSWSKSMRPDFTLSVWPAVFSEDEAEKQELIIHIHFDAKYKIDNISEIFGQPNLESGDLDNEKSDWNKEFYKNADLLKMHAYKDAIRRTAGAYVIYPGTEKLVKFGFHEVIPGLGAFPIRPSLYDDGTSNLRQFVLDVIDHFLNRSTQQERLSYHIYDIHKYLPQIKTKEILPEIINQTRARPPAEICILIGYCKNQSQYEWIKKNRLYNFRMESNRGSLRVGPKEAASEFLLLHLRGNSTSDDIWQITELGPRVFSKKELLERDYPSPSGDFYLVYIIDKIDNSMFSGVTWDLSKLEAIKRGRSSALPFAVTMEELMKVKI